MFSNIYARFSLIYPAEFDDVTKNLFLWKFMTKNASAHDSPLSLPLYVEMGFRNVLQDIK